MRSVDVVVRAEPVLAPLPSIPDSVEELKSIRGECVDRSRVAISVLDSVAFGKGSLPDVASVLAIRMKIVAPGISFLDKPPAGRKLPLGLSWKPLPGPFTVGLCVIPTDVHDWVVKSVRYV
jgi:hypothetical protein